MITVTLRYIDKGEPLNFEFVSWEAALSFFITAMEMCESPIEGAIRREAEDGDVV